MGITRTPPDFAINEALQSYFQIVLKPNEPYGSYQQVQTYLRPDEDPFQSDDSKSSEEADDNWEPQTIPRGPLGYDQLTLYERVRREAWQPQWKRPQNKGAAPMPHPQPEKPLLLRTLEDLQVPLPLLGKQVRAATFGKVVHKYNIPLFFCVFKFKKECVAFVLCMGVYTPGVCVYISIGFYITFFFWHLKYFSLAILIKIRLSEH